MNTIPGIRITTEGEQEVIEFESGSILDSMYQAIDCDLVQMIGLDCGVDAIFDEEGKYNGAQPNRRATQTVRSLGFQFFPGDSLSGSVIFLGHTAEGETVGLTEKQRKLITVAAG
jgi:hypothetical protein